MGKHWISLKDLRDIKKRKSGFKKVSSEEIKQKSVSSYKPLIN